MGVSKVDKANINKNDKIDIRHIYTKTSILSKIPDSLYCFTCNKEKKVKRLNPITRIRRKMKQQPNSPCCITCGNKFNVIKVSIPAPTRIFLIKKLCKKLFKRFIKIFKNNK